MNVRRLAAIALVATVFTGVGTLAGQIVQPSPAGASDNSGPMLTSLRKINVRLGLENQQLIAVNDGLRTLQTRVDAVGADIGTTANGAGLRGETNADLGAVCAGILSLAEDPTLSCPTTGP
jgi:hypothetical protein